MHRVQAADGSFHLVTPEAVAIISPRGDGATIVTAGGSIRTKADPDTLHQQLFGGAASDPSAPAAAAQAQGGAGAGPVKPAGT